MPFLIPEVEFVLHACGLCWEGILGWLRFGLLPTKAVTLWSLNFSTVTWSKSVFPGESTRDPDQPN